ncbi:MAG TPA: hypothetical protein VML55_12970, partial [Planctomycetaceae bacterium]|nr:hypothetical protein [Planctomycetaceae bacterium]
MPARRDSAKGCSGFRRTDLVSRREALRIGGLFGFGLTLPALLRRSSALAGGSLPDAAPAAAGTFGRAKRVIVLFLHGGHPQQ